MKLIWCISAKKETVRCFPILQLLCDSMILIIPDPATQIQPEYGIDDENGQCDEHGDHDGLDKVFSGKGILTNREIIDSVVE